MTAQLLAPCRHPDEVRPLIDAGATALYCGLMDPSWTGRWGRAVLPNRRGPGGNLADFPRLVDLVRRAARRGVPVALAVNAPVLDDARHQALLETVRRAVAEAGIHGVIAGDVGLLADLARSLEGVEVVASTLCTARNASAVRLLRDLGARRVILSRQLSLEEISAIRRAVPDVALEAFVLNDACAFEEGCCSTTHALGGFDDVYCATPWLDPRSSAAARPRWRARYTAHVEALTLRAYGAATRLPLGPCGLCAVPDLLELGIDGLKVVGREAHPYRKVRSVQVVRQVLDATLEGGAEAGRRRALALRDDAPGCRGGLSCLYPEARPAATARRAP